MKKFSILVCLIILFTTSFAEMKIPQPTVQFFVNDFADVITKSDEEEIFNISKKLYEKSGNSTQVVVVTIKSLNGYSIEEYANELFNKWGIGDKEKNDGALILLSVGDRESRIEVGYGLEGVLTDAGTGRIQDQYMIPYYKNNEFSKGLVNGTNAICRVIDGDLVIKNSSTDTSYHSSDLGKESPKNNNLYNKECFYIGLILAIPIYLFCKFRGWIFLLSGIIFFVGFQWLELDKISIILSMLMAFLGGVFIMGLLMLRLLFGAVGGSGRSGRSGGGFSGGGGRSGGGGSSRSF